MASRPPPARRSTPSSERIPFYRNVKTIGILAQVIFAAIVLFAVFTLYSNVTTALQRANLPANFSFLNVRAGIPIGETPIAYSTSDPYWRAFLIGFLNTLRVALIGVVLASLLGVLVGVMRLSSNWLVRQIASAYVEVIRNTPLAVQIIFWFTAVLTTVPPRVSNPIELPGGGLLSNIGLALPWVHATYRFPAFVPWLVAAAVLAIVVYVVRVRQIERSDRPGRAWPPALLALVLVAGIGYAVNSVDAQLPDGIATDFRADRGRGTVFIDTNSTGAFDRGDPVIGSIPTIVRVEQGVLTATSQNFTESRSVVRSTFRFPFLREGEYEAAEVRFVNPDEATHLRIHFLNAPSIGVLYEDRNENGVFDPGEEIDAATGAGFSGVPLEMLVTGFERRIVTDRDGQVRVPRFNPPAVAEEPAAPTGGNPNLLFGAPAAQTQQTAGELEATITLLPVGPLVASRPHVPVANYEGGVNLSTSYLALLLALVIYTAAFIAEIVRGGIQAVARGQTEAARALGLSGRQIFNLIVFPQALRIILPPMISQYLNLTKNSSLAPLAAYAELFAISAIIANQTGASVPVVLMLIASYLIISLTFALILNVVNSRIAIVER